MHTQLPANRLRELLTKRGLRSIDVAARCRVNQSTVLRWEKTIIPQQKLPVIAEMLGVSVPYLAGWTDHNGESDGDDAPTEEAVA